jgi:hypothetical protein
MVHVSKHVMGDKPVCRKYVDGNKINIICSDLHNRV